MNGWRHTSGFDPTLLDDDAAIPCCIVVNTLPKWASTPNPLLKALSQL